MLDCGRDQAEGLRSFLQEGMPRLMAFALNERERQAGAWVGRVARILPSMGCRPLVIDAGRGAVATAMGIRKLPYDLLDLLTGRLEFDAVAHRTADGIYVVRADEGIEAFVSSGRSAAELLRAFANLSHGFDTLLLAMPAGELASVAEPSSTVPVVLAPLDDDGLTRAYATIKELATGYGYAHFAVALTGSCGKAEAEAAHQRLAYAVRNFLQAGVTMAGWMPTLNVGHSGSSAALQYMAQALLDNAATPVARH